MPMRTVSLRTCRFSEEDFKRIGKLAMNWGISHADIIRIAVKLFLLNPKVDFNEKPKKR